MRVIPRVQAREPANSIFEKTALLACIDARLTVEDLLGLNTGEAHIIRNTHGIATDDAIRSLIISHELLGTQEFFLVINYTDCGMLTFADEELRNKLAQKVHDRYKWTQVPLVSRSRGECEEPGRQDKVNTLSSKEHRSLRIHI
ncbi:MAG TPA: carbonic anhydrase [Nitrososphaeraceae archaeon]|nr:carbonic anhydrase [Nitrososphaeraceae archaeon]